LIHLPAAALQELDPEEVRRLEAQAAAEAMLSVLPGDRQGRLAMLGARLDLFSAATLKIRTKDGGPLWPFVMNPIQLRYLAHLRKHYSRVPGVDSFRGMRDLIVKPRQLGFSTFIAALFFMDGFLSPGRVSVVLTHDLKISQELLRTYKTLFENLPAQLRDAVVQNTASKYELEVEFKAGSADDPPSRFVIATEGGNPWRGGTIHNLHASEAAFYKDWAAFQASFVNAVPRNGNIAFETTVNGFNEYYDAVDDALHGRSSDRVVFYPWFDHPEYRMPWDELSPEQAARPLEPDELALMAPKAQGGQELTREQIAWRRWKKGTQKGLFAQEYPETLLGAFLHSGSPFFDLAAVNEGHEAAKRAPAPREPRSFVQVWEDPRPGELYMLSADVSEGKNKGTQGSDPEHGGSDFSRAYVTHVESLRTVAAIGGRIRPVDYARIIDKVGRAYEAVVAVERNNHGHTILAGLEASCYPEVYRHREYNQSSGTAFLQPGFPTTTTTRPMILDALDEVIRRRAYYNPDPRFWVECNSFHLNEMGKAEATSGKHDDRVMAAAIGVFLCTLGRSGWNAGLADGSDSAGFPRQAPAALPPPPPPPTAPSPEPVKVHRMVDTAEVASLLTDLAGARGVEANCCGVCSYCEGGVCSQLRARVKANMPACEWFYPHEDDQISGPAGLSEDEQWTL